MALARRQIASCTLGGLSVVTMAYDDVTLDFLGLRLRGRTRRRVTIRLHQRGRGDIVRTRERNIGTDETLTANFKMVRKTIRVGTPKEQEIIDFPDRISASFEWIE